MKQMNKKIKIILLLLFSNAMAFAQKIPANIYKGGNGDGWASLNHLQSSANIFKGGNGDGWASLNYLQNSADIFKGGSGDGWASLNYIQNSTNIFKGGSGDGWASADFLIVTYIFNGNGNWSKPINWIGNKVPPSTVSAGVQIMINPAPGGDCILDVPLTISGGASLTVAPNARFILQSNLTLQ